MDSERIQTGLDSAETSSKEQTNESEKQSEPTSSKGQHHESSQEQSSVNACSTQCQKPNPVHDKGATAQVKKGGCCPNLNTKQDEVSENSDESDNSSEISAFSNMSGESWQPVQGPISWVQEQMRQGKSPRKILEDLVPAGTEIPDELDHLMLWKIIINIVSEPPKRKKLQHINTLEDVLGLLNTCKKIIVLTGAGVSVSCGIPDFRSRDGVYSRLAKDFPNLPDPQAMFDIHFFRNDPRPFFKFAKEIYPGQFKPSLCHHFIKLLEKKGKLLRNYTQNIDTLEQVAGIENVIQCHGSFANATCTVCGLNVNSDAIKQDILNQVIPHCPKCSPCNGNAVMKPDIVFFGESLPEHFHNQMTKDKDECDLLIVIGSSLKVRPVALIPNSLPPHVPQVLINRERLSYLNFDTELLGNCDDIVGDLCRRLGSDWDQLADPGPVLTEVCLSALPTPPLSPSLSEDSNYCPLPSSCERLLQSSVSKEDVPQGSGDVKSPDSGANNIQTSNTSETIIETTCSVTSGEKEVQHKHTHVTESDRDIISSDSKCQSGSHSHSLKRPHSAISDPSVSSERKTRKTSNCSSEEVSDIVTAGHRKEVVSEPSHSDHDQHSHHHHHHHTQHSSPIKNDMSEPVEPSHSNHQQHHRHHHTAHSSPAKHVHSCTSIKDADSMECSEPQPNDVSLPSEHESEAKKVRLSPQPQTDINPEEIDLELDSTEDENLMKMWQSRPRISLATRLSDDQVLYLPPSRYIFKGAEVYSDDDSDDSDDSDEQINENTSSNNNSEDDENSTKDSSDLSRTDQCPDGELSADREAQDNSEKTSQKVSDCVMEESELKTCEPTSTGDNEKLDTSSIECEINANVSKIADSDALGSAS